MPPLSPAATSGNACAPRLLAGRTVVVTGAARGVGRVIAEACAAAGARLVLADLLIEAGMATTAALTARGHAARFVAVDLADPASIEAFAADIAATEGAVHGLVNNAAVATAIGGPAFDAIELETWDLVMRANVRGTWLVTRAPAPLLRVGGSGPADVNLASDTALWGAPRLLAYVASKGAILAMTRSLARELGPEGIGVTAIAPGILRNEETEDLSTGTPSPRRRLRPRRARTPGAGGYHGDCRISC